jgi:hypothetical protein
MTEDDGQPVDPLPDWWTNAYVDVDRDLINRLITELIVAERPDLMDEMMAGELSWELEPFDEHGWTTLSLRRKATGEATDVGAQCHWSAIAKRR